MIQILITGGTIDKQYDVVTGKLVFNNSSIKTMIAQARLNDSVLINTIFLKDSLDIDTNDITQIVDFCQHCDSNKILIIHGTDTMINTAKKLSIIRDKTIILFGAMLPYSVNNSDALFNFGFAFASIKCTLKDNIYIAMNGELFHYDAVVKNKILAKFMQL